MGWKCPLSFVISPITPPETLTVPAPMTLIVPFRGIGILPRIGSAGNHATDPNKIPAWVVSLGIVHSCDDDPSGNC